MIQFLRQHNLLLSKRRPKSSMRSSRRSRGSRAIAGRLELLEPRLPLDGTLTFSEIMYHPFADNGDQEWIELHNQMAVNVDLSGWRLEGGIDFEFAPGTVIAGGEYLVVAREPEALQASTGLANIQGPFDGRLANSTDEILLYSNGGRLVDEVQYGDSGPWPVAPDGGGVSLAKLTPGAASDDPAHWASSVTVGGTPGQENFPSGLQLGESTMLFDLDKTWRFSDEGLDLGASWKDVGYDDSTWQVGTGLFFAADGPLPGPKNTPIDVSANTVYFRGSFNFEGDAAQTVIAIDHVIDDGAIVYLNGSEAHRFQMPPGEVNYNTSAAAIVEDATRLGRFELPSSLLVQGENLLAVEVHQATSSSSLTLLDVGSHVDGPVPSNLALGAGATAFAKDLLTGYPAHSIPHLNDGFYGNSYSWIGGADNTFAGVNLNGQFNIDRIAFGRSNVTGGDACGVCTDRTPGTYTIQYTTAANPNAGTPNGNWTTIGTLTYSGAANEYLRHLYQFAPVTATGVRILVSEGGLSGGIAIDEIEVFPSGPPDLVFGAALQSREILNPLGELLLTELSGANSAEPFFVELVNPDTQVLQLEQYVLESSTGDSFPLPSQSLAPGEYLHFDEAALGFRPAEGERLLLYSADKTYLLDAVEMKTQPQARRLDLENRWQIPSQATPSAENVFDVNDSIVINEIMYHGPLLPASEGVFNTEELIPLDTSWKYDDSGELPGQNWTSAAFDDSGWAVGPALLGSEAEGLSIPQQTTLAAGNTTYYFRKAFNYDGPLDRPLSLQLNSVVDDGAIFYLNGQEIHRFNMPLGVVTNETLANASVIGAEPVQSLLLPANSLLSGQNVLAVEVHQSAVVQQAAGPQISAAAGFEIGYDGNEGDFFNSAAFPLVPDNLALALRAVSPFGTGALVSPHSIGGVNDGVYGNSNSWISAPSADPFIGLRFPSPVNIRSIAWGRDNGNNVNDACGGQCTDRSLGAYTIQYTEVAAPGVSTAETGNASTGWRTIGAITYSSSQFQQYLRHRYDVSLNGESITATGLRIKVSDAGIAIDEIEVYDQPQGGLTPDIALAAALSVVETIEPALPAGEDPTEWIEMHNTADQPVDLSGWSLGGGIDYDFPAGTVIDAQGYLVVAKDASSVQAQYPGANVIGDFDGGLANSTDTLDLLDPQGNLVDHVAYFDGGRWPGAADGGGASLELKDPAADNAAPEAWSASQESGPWLEYTYRGVMQADGGSTIYREFIFGLLDAGQILLDDIAVIEDPDGAATSILQNGFFESDVPGQPPAKWRLNGNHGGQVVVDPEDPLNQVLLLQASGAAEDRYNHAETTFLNNRPVTNGQVYEVSFRAKWLAGSNQLHSRFYFNRLPHTTLLEKPEAMGTPGAANSTRVVNLGPTFQQLQHQPIVPDVGQSVNVRVQAFDPDQVAAVDLHYRVDSGGWQTASMIPGQANDFTGVIPGQAAGATIQFYVEGRDALGGAATFPTEGVDSRALIRVQDGQASDSAPHTFRIIMLPADATRLHDPIYRMSNGRSGATVVYDETEVFYDVSVRLRGSNAGRSDNNHVSFNVDFDPMQPLRGVHESVSLDRSGRGGRAPLTQDEIIVKHIAQHAGGVPSTIDDLVQLIAPQAVHTRTAALILGGYDNRYLDAQFENGSDGTLFKLELAYVPNGTVGGNPENPKLPTPYNHPPSKELQDLGEDKEAYRQHLLIRNNRDRDDYSQIVALSQAMSLSGPAFAERIDQLIDVDQWGRTFAVQSLTGIVDVYTRGGLNHNIQFYVRPEDNRVLALMWDWDFAFTSSTSQSLIGQSSNTARIFSIPANRRLFHGHLYDLIQTTFNTNYLEPWINHYGEVASQNFAAITSFVRDRAAFVLSNLPAQIPFSITTNGGNDFDEDTATVELQGQGWINVREVRVAGAAAPLNVTWLDDQTWRTDLSLVDGVNAIALEAYDHQGQLVGTDTITITADLETGDPRDSLRITEVMYHPPEPTAQELAAGFSDEDDFEFIEIKNVGQQPVNLAGVRLANAVEFTFSDIDLAPGQIALVVEDQQAFAERYGVVPQVVGLWSGALNNGGESVELLDARNFLIQQFTYQDNGSWPGRADGFGSSLEVLDTEGDYGDGGNWRSSAEFGGSPAADGEGPRGDVLINEVLTHTDPPQVDAIELFNASGAAIEVGGWFLSDTRDDYRKFQIPLGVVLPAGEYRVFDESDFNPGMGANTNDFALDSAHGDDTWLLEADANGQLLRFVDHVDFIAAANGESFGRWPNGSGELYPMLSVTLGQANSGPRVGPLVISELHYAPQDPDGEGPIDTANLEFIEIYNPTQEVVDLSGWRITGGVQFDFNAVAIQPEGFLVVLSFDPGQSANSTLRDDFLAVYNIGVDTPLVGGFSGQLENTGERVRLRRPDEPPLTEPDFVPLLLEDEVNYQSVAPWPEMANGGGLSLTRLGADLWGDEAASWTAQTPTPGSFQLRAPRVLRVDVNTLLDDPADLDAGPQPTSWATQQSDLRSIHVTFTQPMSLGIEDLRLTNLGVDAPADADVTVSLDAAQWELAGNELTLEFAAGVLENGVYQLEILPSATDLNGLPLDGDGDGVGGDGYVLAGDASNRLVRLEGDWNGDGGVTIFDFPTFAYWFGLMVPRAPEYLDLNHDQGVTIFDFPTFAANFGDGVVYPMGLASSGVSVPTRAPSSFFAAAPALRQGSWSVPESRLPAASRVAAPAETEVRSAALLELLAEWHPRRVIDEAAAPARVEERGEPPLPFDFLERGDSSL